MSDINFITDETVRLRLRPFIESDLPAFIAYRNDPIVARYQSWEGISEAEAEAFLREQQAIQPGIPGQGMQIAIEYKETGVLIGDCYFIVTSPHAWKGGGFSFSRLRVSCFTGGCPTSFRPNGSYTSSTGRHRESLGQNGTRCVSISVVDHLALWTLPGAYFQIQLF
jgi:hypothetical protein